MESTSIGMDLIEFSRNCIFVKVRPCTTLGATLFLSRSSCFSTRSPCRSRFIHSFSICCCITTAAIRHPSGRLTLFPCTLCLSHGGIALIDSPLLALDHSAGRSPVCIDAWCDSSKYNVCFILSHIISLFSIDPWSDHES